MPTSSKPKRNSNVSPSPPKKAAPKKVAPKKAAAKKAAAKKAAAKKATPKRDTPNQTKAAAPSKTENVFSDLKESAGVWVDAINQAIPPLVNAATQKTQELTREAQQQAKLLADTAQVQLRKGKEFIAEHPTGAVASALGVAVLAGLAAGKSTYKAIRRTR